jgi:hypothetical protein
MAKVEEVVQVFGPVSPASLGLYWPRSKDAGRAPTARTANISRNVIWEFAIASVANRGQSARRNLNAAGTA